MIFISNAKGTIQAALPSPIYQGSNLANEVVLIAPFAQANQVDCAITLPNGARLQPILLTAVENFSAQGLTDADGKNLSAWSVDIPETVTEFSGDAKIQFRIYTGNASKQIISTSSTGFYVQKGVAPILPDNPDSDAWTTILQAIATAQSSIDANTSDIAENTAQIQQNTSDIATHAQQIDSNTNTIASNTKKIQSNSESITKKLDKVTSATPRTQLYAKTASGDQTMIDLGESGAVDINLENGEGEGSLAQVSSYAESENRAVAPFSAALGSGNTAGSRAFVIVGGGGSDWDEGTYKLDSVNGIEAGQRYSVFGYSGANGTGMFDYVDPGEITQVNSDEKTVYVTKYRTVITQSDPNMLCSFRIVGRPDLGTVYVGENAYSEGNQNKSNFIASHTEGFNNISDGAFGHAEGCMTKANFASHSEGFNTTAKGQYSHAEGASTEASGSQSHAEGNGSVASGASSHAEGGETLASGNVAHAEGQGTKASAQYTHAEGHNTSATSEGAHAEGNFSTAIGSYSHVEGSASAANGNYSHAEGYNSIATGGASHAEGQGGSAVGTSSHVEGAYCSASARYAHAEGSGTTASGDASHAGGLGTIADKASQTAIGQYNDNADSAEALFVVGNGTSDSARSNAFKVNKDGTVYSTGRFSQALAPANNNDLATLQYANYIAKKEASGDIKPTSVSTGALTATSATINGKVSQTGTPSADNDLVTVSFMRSAINGGGSVPVEVPNSNITQPGLYALEASFGIVTTTSYSSFVFSLDTIPNDENSSVFGPIISVQEVNEDMSIEIINARSWFRGLSFAIISSDGSTTIARDDQIKVKRILTY